MTPSTYLRSRVDPSVWTAALVAGDLLALLAFVVVGVDHHGFDPASRPVRVLGNVVPFWLGWFLAAFVGGLYTADARSSVRRAVGWAVPAWAAAVVVSQALRSTAAFPGNASLAFALVSLVFGGAVLLGWRGLAAALVGWER